MGSIGDEFFGGRGQPASFLAPTRAVSAVSSPVGSGAQSQPKSNLMQFSLKI